MWTIVAIVGSLLGFWLVIRQCRRFPDLPTQILLTLIWLRFALQAFPDYTVTMSFGGFSVIALFTIGITAFLISIAPKRLFTMKRLAPIYIFIVIVIVSSTISNALSGLSRDLFKWAYVISIIVIIMRSIRIFGLPNMMSGLIWTTATPLILQLMSLLFGEKKVSQSDGSVNYIGGYFHESQFSYVALTFISLALFSQFKNRRTEIALVVIGVSSLLLANYRSSIIAAIPLVLVALWNLVSRTWGAAGRLMIASSLIIFALLVGPYAHKFIPDRYVEITDFADNISMMNKPIEELSRQEKNFFSGRVAIWSEYLQAFRDSTFDRKLIGHGAHSYRNRMRLYAHNTFISYLFEFGIIGLIAISYIIFTNIALSFMVSDPGLRRRLLAAHLSFFVMNLTAMPLWSTEGSTFYALILAATWAAYDKRPTTNLTQFKRAEAHRVP